MTNPLVAERKDSTQSFTGVPILESADETKKAIESGDWAAGVMGAAGTALDALGMAMDPFGSIIAAGVGWLMEHVGPLSDALDTLTGDADQIKAHSETWKNISAELGAVNEEMANLVNSDTSAWVGEAADAYRTRSEDTGKLIAAAQSAADGAANGIATAGEVVAAVRTLVRDIIAELVGHLVSWALQVLATLGIAMAWVLPQVIAEIAKVAAKIADITTKLVKAMKALMPLVKKLGDSFSDTSKALKNIKADGSSAPPPKDIRPPGKNDPDGTPAPTNPASTTPSSAGPGSGAPDAPPPSRGPQGDGNGPIGDAPPAQTSSAGTRGTPDGPTNAPNNKPDSPRDRAIPSEDLCTGGTEPVDLATGHVVMTETDLQILGPLSLVLERMHISSYRAGRWFGPSWTSTLDQRLEVDDEHVCYFSPDGMILVYPLPSDDAQVLPVEGPRWPLRVRDGGYSLENPQRNEVLHFGRLGERDRVLPLLAVEDDGGRRIDIEHHRFGPPKAIRHSDGYRVEIDSARERVTAIRVVDPEQNLDVLVMRYGYDDRGRLAEVTNSSGKALLFQYDDAGRLAEWQDRNGFWFRYIYDEHGRCVRTVGDKGFFDSAFTYDRERRITRYTDSLGGVKEFEFNDAKQVVRESDALGNTTLSTWDRYDRLLFRTDPLGRTTYYQYDSLGRPRWITRPDDSVVRLRLNEDNTVASITVDDGERTWTRSYDEELDAFSGKVGVAAELRLDSLRSGRAQTAEPETTEPDRRLLDLFGRPRQASTPYGGQIQLGWTVDGHRAWHVDSLGNRVQWRYDPEGNQIAQVDETGGVTATEYGPFEIELASVDETGARTTRTYDTERRLTSVTNPQGQTWRYVYDLAGRVIEEHDFDGRVLRYGYDAAGQLVRSVNGAGEETEYVYDSLGNLVEWRAPSGVTKYTYSPVGHLIRATNDDAVLEFERDDQGRITAETSNGRTVTFRYDNENGAIRRQTPSGVASAWNYDAAGRATGLSFAGHSSTFGYDAAGRQINRSVDDGVTLVQTYDGEQRLNSQEVAARSGQPVLRRRFHYRPDGELIATDDGFSGSIRYQIDPSGRVVEVITPDRRESYRYDGLGNIVASNGLGDAETGPRRYAGNSLIAAGAVNFQYDAQGRLALRTDHTGRNWRYAWDSYDRLVAVTTPEGVVWRYRYDPVGRRIAKQRLVPNSSAVAEQVDFVWDGGTLIEQVHTDSTGRRAVTTWAHHPDDDAPVAQLERGADGRERFHAVITDQVGTPTDLIDPSGMLTWHRRTSLWGKELPAQPSAASTPLRFPGQYADLETGLNYNVYRYYDPATGRYLSQDPLGLAPAPNPVAYVSNPHSAADPLGLVKNKPGRKHNASNDAPATGKGGNNAANLGGSNTNKPEGSKADQKPVGTYDIDGKKYNVEVEAHQNKHQKTFLPGLDTKNVGQGTQFPSHFGDQVHQDYFGKNAAQIADLKRQEALENYKSGGTDAARLEAKQNQEKVWQDYQRGDASYDDVRKANEKLDAAKNADVAAQNQLDNIRHDGFLTSDGKIYGGADPKNSIDGVRYQVTGNFSGGSNDVSYHCYPATKTSAEWEKSYGKTDTFKNF
ncbi:DUF6531 domain-containing protein [Saccharopolyspora sp. K220]|uniref:RHS repeat-associated core domain-containing protein n=1 Tax=Saccharopolyspora soli TaxID=2926618 RepID=UPI001F56270B|nr:RHS repeat-associated core domain-containing protein [Saccharopolyspora soli]MCI2415794.1 DUF6531 domain-containing protein [Saccharopolyspora soli]